MLHRTVFCSNMSIRVHSTNSSGHERTRSVRCFVSGKISLLVVSTGRTTPVAPVIRRTCQGKVPIVAISQGVLSSGCATCVNTSGCRVNHTMNGCVTSHLGKGNGVIRLAKLDNSAPTVRHRRKFVTTVDRFPRVGLVSGTSTT